MYRYSFSPEGEFNMTFQSLAEAAKFISLNILEGIALFRMFGKQQGRKYIVPVMLRKIS